MIQYENNSYELCDGCRGLIFKCHKGCLRWYRRFKDEPHSDWSFGIKCHNMTEPAMNDWLLKDTVRFVEMLIVSKFSNIITDVHLKHLTYFAALVVMEVKTKRVC